MKDGIHPPYTDCQVSCSCGNSFATRATVPELKIAVCSSCHPFYTGNQKILDAEGRIDRFRRKYGLDKKPAA